MTQLRHYTNPNGDEYIVIVTEAGDEEVAGLVEGDKLEAVIELDGDFTAWPTDRVLRQER